MQRTHFAPEVDADDTPVPDGMARVTFHPQAWIKRWAVDVDAHGETTFLVPEADVVGMEDDTDESDELMHHPAAPLWVRRWSNAFYITIEHPEQVVGESDALDTVPREITDEDRDAWTRAWEIARRLPQEGE